MFGWSHKERRQANENPDIIFICKSIWSAEDLHGTVILQCYNPLGAG